MDKVAILAGGTSGIGRFVAVALVDRGAKVDVIGRNQSRLDDVAKVHRDIEPVRAHSGDPSSAALGRWDQTGEATHTPR